MNKEFTEKKLALTQFMHRHQAFLVLTCVLVILTFVILRINSLGNIAPDASYFERETSSLKPVQFNQEAITQIEALRDSNVSEPTVELPRDRNNPFTE